MCGIEHTYPLAKTDIIEISWRTGTLGVQCTNTKKAPRLMNHGTPREGEQPLPRRTARRDVKSKLALCPYGNALPTAR